MVAPTTVPGYKLSEWHPLAHEKVRFVGEPVAMCVAPTRAEAEDLTEEIEVEFDELPVLVDALAARVEKNIRVHEQWNDNLFLTLSLDNGYDANAKGAPVVVRRELSLNRQAMVPMEGKAILAHWDERSDQLVVYYSTQVPHVVRVGLAQFLGLDQGQGEGDLARRRRRLRLQGHRASRGAVRRVAGAQVSPAVPLHRGSARASWWSEPMRASITTGSPRMPTSAAGCWRSTPRLPSTAVPIRAGRSRRRSSRDRRPATCPAPTISAATAARPIA